MAALTSVSLMRVWEQSARRHPIDRALLLLAIAAPQTPPNALADIPLGVRNARLMELRRNSFGAHLQAWADCTACGARLEFELDPALLPPVPATGDTPLEVAGHRFHRPTSRHLARLADAPDADAAARQLLRDCAVSPHDLPHDSNVLSELFDAVDAAMDAADPWAELSVQLRCPDCGHADDAAFDIASYLWEEINSHAQRLLDDIHTLAAAYGWSEPDILALSDARRSAYLARVQA